MEMTRRRFRAIIAIILALFFPITLFSFGSAQFDRPYQYPIVLLDDNWTVSLRGNLYFNQTREQIGMAGSEPGETLVITTQVPANNIISPCLYFETTFATVEVYINRDMIYSFGKEYVQAGTMVPKKQHLIPLGRYENNKYDLKIRLTATEPGQSYSFKQILIGNRDDLGRKIIQRYRLALFIGIFLVMFAVLLLVFSPLLAVRQGHDLSSAVYALDCFLIGGYIMYYNGLADAVLQSSEMGTFWEYFMIYATPIGLMLTILVNRKMHAGKSNRLITVIVIHTAFLLVAIGMHVTNIAHIERALVLFHLLSAVEGAMVLIVAIRIIVKMIRTGNTYKQTLEDNIIGLGILILVICAFIDLIRMYLSLFNESRWVFNSDIRYTVLGSLLFATCLIMNYFFHCIAYINNEKIRLALEGIAYTDSLTQLANRAKCEQTLTQVAQEMEPYTIISLDLDRLKQINDTQGHQAGDSLIRGFADILYETFTDALLVGRMGGDEFVVVMKGADRNLTEGLIRKLKEKMAYYNAKAGRFKYSASWGIAYSTELPMNSSHQIYMLADSRMYQMKQEHHQQTLDKLYRALSPKGGSGNA